MRSAEQEFTTCNANVILFDVIYTDISKVNVFVRFLKHNMVVTIRFFRYCVVLNGFDSIKKALLYKSTKFADRQPPFTGSHLNKERRGSSSESGLRRS